MAEADSGSSGVRGAAALGLATVGVVYGDIGTSPLYAIKECFGGPHALAASPANVLGVASLVFWSIILVVTLKYVLFVMRADNRGEGGILALLALAGGGERRAVGPVVVMGLLGAALFYGDGMITPAISVLSAVEGLTVATPALEHAVVPIALVVLAGLFAIQSRGTALVGRLFGPVMVVWFLALAVLGARGILAAPEVAAALDPRHALTFVQANGWRAFLVLGSVVLAVTGGEALYADMGHFGRKPIRLAWFGLVLPALVTNYFGQAALLLADPSAARNPFYLMVPSWALVPMVVLATMATVIASQAVITGVFSLLRQAVQLGLIPRMTIRHTSASAEGQIYIPQANWTLLAGIVALVLAFRGSSELAAAYGIAVTGTMSITTVLALVVARKLWGWSLWVCLAVGAGFLVLDAAFLGANLVKVADGGWVPLAVGLAVFVLMQTWKHGRRLLSERRRRHAVPVGRFLEDWPTLNAVRVPGTAIYLTGKPADMPPALLHNLRHNKVLHERVVMLTVETAGIPRVPRAERVTVEHLAPGFQRVSARYGFFQDPDIPDVLDLARAQGLAFDMAEASFFVGRHTVTSALAPKMPPWRRAVFMVMDRLAVSTTEFFRIPAAQVVELGTRVQL